MLPTYDEIAENGTCVYYANSLHCWDEVWECNGKKYQVVGVIGHEDVTVREIKDETPTLI